MLGSHDPYPSSPVCCIFLANPRQSCRDKKKAQNTKTVRSEYGGTSFISFRIRSRTQKVKTAPTLETPVRFLPHSTQRHPGMSPVGMSVRSKDCAHTHTDVGKGLMPIPVSCSSNNCTSMVGRQWRFLVKERKETLEITGTQRDALDFFAEIFMPSSMAI